MHLLAIRPKRQMQVPQDGDQILGLHHWERVYPDELKKSEVCCVLARTQAP